MNGRGQPHGFFFPPFPLLTKPRNPLSEVKPSLQQGSFWRLFTLNIFWPAEIGGRGRPSAPPAPAPPVLRGDRRGRVKVPICLRPSLPLRPPGEGENRCLLCWGNAFSEGSRRLGARQKTLQKPNFCQETGRPVSPLFRRGAVLPRSQGATKGQRSRKEAERGRVGAGLGLAIGRPGPSRGYFGKFRRKAAPQHRQAPGQAQASREGRRALSPALKSHRRPSLFPSILLVAVSLPSPPSTPARKHTTSPPPFSSPAEKAALPLLACISGKKRVRD